MCEWYKLYNVIAEDKTYINVQLQTLQQLNLENQIHRFITALWPSVVKYMDEDKYYESMINR